jgi:hypothetical protein
MLPSFDKENRMDIMAINEAIEILENKETNFDSVSELAMLYIVRNNYQSISDSTSDELNDILPCYQKYREVKGRYQQGMTSEGEVIRALKLLGQEIKEFIDNLYCNTDMNKERLYIKEMICQLNEKYSK